MSRPITYSRRDTLACEARPEASVLMKVAHRKIDWNSLPPTYSAISGSAASGSWKRTMVGKKSCMKNDTLMKITPPYSAVRKMARGITLAASGVSSDSVVTASKPRNEKQRIVAPVIIGSRCAFSLMNGWRHHTVPIPSPLCRPCTTR